MCVHISMLRIFLSLDNGQSSETTITRSVDIELQFHGN